jgi:hypothetical protein
MRNTEKEEEGEDDEREEEELQALTRASISAVFPQPLIPSSNTQRLGRSREEEEEEEEEEDVSAAANFTAVSSRLTRV